MKRFDAKRIFTLLLVTLLALCLYACSVEEAVEYIDAGIAIYEAIQEADEVLDSTEKPAVTGKAPQSTTGPPIETEKPEDTAEPEKTINPTSAPTLESTAEPTPEPTAQPTAKPSQEPEPTLYIDEDGSYTSKEDVALYIHLYGKLPENFMTKSEARKLGWEGGGLDSFRYGYCIGGDRFGNYEELLPIKNGRTYKECDIDTLHASSRGAKRIVFSNDGLIYYTDDHYESFTLLYGEE